MVSRSLPSRVSSLPACVVCWPMPQSLLSRSLSALPRSVRVEHIRDLDDVRAILSCEREACMLAPLPDDARSLVVDDLVQVRQLYPRVPILVIASAGESAYQAARRLGRFAATELITAAPDLPDRIVAALRRAHEQITLAQVWVQVRVALPISLEMIFRSALRQAYSPVAATTLAESLRMSDRGLRKYCARHSIPNPQTIVGWARLLIAGFYLDDKGRLFGLTPKKWTRT